MNARYVHVDGYDSPTTITSTGGYVYLDAAPARLAVRWIPLYAAAVLACGLYLWIKWQW